MSRRAQGVARWRLPPPLSLRTAAGRGYLRAPGRPCPPCPQGAPTAPGSAPTAARLRHRGAGKAGGGRRPAAVERVHTAERVCPSKGFVLPSPSAEEGRRNRLRFPSEQDPRVPSASGRAGKALGRERRAASARLLPLQGALEAPAEARTEAQTLGAVGARRLPEAEEPPIRSSLHPRRYLPCLALPCPCHLPPLLPPSSRCPPHAYGWAHAPAALG